MSAFRFVRRLRRPSPPKTPRTPPAAPRLVCLEDRTNPGPLTFDAQPGFASSFNFGGEVVRAANFDGSNGLDYVVGIGGSIGPQLEVCINNGTIFGNMTFSRQTLTVPDGGLASLSLATGDFGGPAAGSAPDGFDDIAVGTANSDGLYIFYSRGDGTFTTASKISFGPGFSFFGEVTGLASGDLNGDDFDDLFLARSDELVAGVSSREYTTFVNNQKGGFTIFQRSGDSGFGSLRDPVLADVDGDGKQDAVAFDGGAFPTPAITKTSPCSGARATARSTTRPSSRPPPAPFPP